MWVPRATISSCFPSNENTDQRRVRLLNVCASTCYRVWTHLQRSVAVLARISLHQSKISHFLWQDKTKNYTLQEFCDTTLDCLSQRWYVLPAIITNHQPEIDSWCQVVSEPKLTSNDFATVESYIAVNWVYSRYSDCYPNVQGPTWGLVRCEGRAHCILHAIML